MGTSQHLSASSAHPHQAKEATRSYGPAMARRAAFLAGVAAVFFTTHGDAVAQVDPTQLPTGGVMISGTGSIMPFADILTVSQSTAEAIMAWHTFDVGEDAAVAFQQPGLQAITLNRILDPNPSQIMGNITANEQVLLVNPNGLTFGPTALTTVRSLIVSTLDTTGPDSIGVYTLQESTAPGVIASRAGTIASPPGGSVSLIGSAVLNNGLVYADVGSINLTVGGVVRLDQAGVLVNAPSTQRVNDVSIQSAITNTGLLNANSGTILLEARTEPGFYTTLIDNSGVISAVNGRVSLIADGGSIRSSGAIDVGAGRLVVSSSDRFDQFVGQIIAGTVQADIRDNATFSAASNQIASLDGLAVGGNLLFSNGRNLTQSAAISVEGSSSFQMAGHDITLTNAGNDFVGAVDLFGDDVSIRDANDLLLRTVDVTTLAVNAGGRALVNGPLDADTLTVESGVLQVGNTAGSTASVNGDVIVNTGATLSGTGRVTGVVTINGTLAAGSSPGTLAVGSLALGGGSTSIFELNRPGLVGGTGPGGNDLVAVTGNLALGGTLDARVASAGYYRLFNYGGTLSGAFDTVTVGQVRTNIAGQVNLSVLGAGQQMQFWDGADVTGNGTVNGGAGTWNAVNTNWTGEPGQAGINDSWQSSVGVFAGAAGGGVSVSGTQSFDTLQFLTDGYTLTGGSLALRPASGTPINGMGAAINIDAGITTLISSVIVDGTGTHLAKVGDGTLILNGTNTYTGGTTISGGVLSISRDANLGAASGGLTFDGGTLAVNSPGLYPSLNRQITLEAGGGTLDIARDKNLYVEGTNGDITGPGSLTKTGAGVLNLLSANSYSGGTTIAQGAIVAEAEGALGTGAVTITGSGIPGNSIALAFYGVSAGALQITNAGSGDITFSDAGGTAGTAAIDLTGSAAGLVFVSGADAGRATITNRGYSRISFLGTSAGDATITNSGQGANSAQTTFGDEGGAYATAGNATITNSNGGATRLRDHSDGGTATFINESGGLTQFLGSSTGDTATVINKAGGRLEVFYRDAGQTSVSIGSVSGDGDIVLGDSTGISGNPMAVQLTLGGLNTDDIIGGVISEIDTSAVAKIGTGTLTLSAQNTYTDGTTVTGGTLLVDGTLAGAVAVGAAGTLGGSGSIAGAVSVDGTLSAGNSPGTLTVGSLALGSGSTSIFELNTPGVVGGSDPLTGNDLVVVGGDLALGGTLDARVASAGYYRLFNYGGDLNGSFAAVSVSGFAATNADLRTNVAGQVNLAVLGTDQLMQFWDGGDTTGNGQVGGGSGTWGNTTNWTGEPGQAAANTIWLGSVGVFMGAAGTVTVDGTQSFDTLQFASDGYVLTGDSLALAPGSGVAGTITVDAGSGATIGSAIVDGSAASLTKAGSGTLILTGANTYTGGTTISGGTLQIGDGGSITGAVDNNSALVFNRSDSAVFGGAITGTGTIRQAGAGMVSLTGDSSAFTGTTAVEAGTLAVGGPLGGTLNVFAAGRLQGSGTVGGTSVAGTIAPGNSIGTLHVAGDITLAAGSVYEVEVNAAGQADRIVATGAASIAGGTVQVLAEAGTYAPATTYTILTADGGRSGTFASVTSNLAFLTPTLGYDVSSVYLTMTRNDVRFDNVGVTRNQIAAGSGIESLGLGHTVYDAVVSLSDTQARAAFDSLSGEIHASAKTALIEDSRFVRDAAIGRIRAGFGDVAAAPAAVPTEGPAAWGQGLGAWGSTDGNGNAAKLDRSTGGFLMGVDAPVFESWRVGALVGYSRTSFDANDRSASGSSDNYHVGLYGGTQWAALGLRAGLAYTWNDLSVSRMVALPGFADSLKAHYDAGTFQAFAELGYRLDTGVASFEPFANLAHVRLKTTRFVEQGGDAALSASSQSTNTSFTTLGLRAASGFTLGTVGAAARGTLGWQHAFGDTLPLSTQAFVGVGAGSGAFTVAGVPIAKDSAVVEAGFDLNFSPMATLGLYYSGQIASDARQHGLKVNLGVRF